MRIGTVAIAGVPIGPGNPCRVVAEIGANHNGNLRTAMRLVAHCASAGADFIKFQAFTLDEILSLRGPRFNDEVPEPWRSMGHTSLRALYEKAQTPHHWFPVLVDMCKGAGVPWFSSVFGPDSLAMLEDLRCAAYKLSAWDADGAEARQLYFDVGATGKPLITSTRDPRPTTRVGDVVLYCPNGYPQRRELLPPHILSTCDGLSFHGTGWEAPLWAAEGWAKMVEVHVQLDDEPSELDAHSSLTVSDLGRLCAQIRRSRIKGAA